MSRHSYKGHDRILKFMIAVLTASAVILSLALFIEAKLNAQAPTILPAINPQASGTPAPLTVVSADYLLSPTSEAEATPTPVPEATPAPFEFLPVYSRAETGERVIAITIDNCTNLESLKTIVRAADEYDAMLTLFPMGSSIMKSEMTEALRYCILEKGYQVENYTWSNNFLYRLSDNDHALEIWAPDMAVDYILGMNYGMHLLRPRNGTGTHDPRTHLYLKQLGYDGLVTWSVNGSESESESLKLSLKPGQIYRFTSAPDDAEKLIAFMRYASQSGYEMVTLNALLGFPENSQEPTDEDILARNMPMPDRSQMPVMTYKAGDRAWQVFLIQSRLAELGYLAQGIDGVYGDGTSAAVIAFQAQHGLPCTGVADADIQRLLFSGEALPAPVRATPVPSPSPQP